jgi:hypothetical protein
MPNHSGHLWQKEIAEFRCEMAANEMLHDRHDEARRLLDEALARIASACAPPCCWANCNEAVGAAEGAIDHWKSVEQQNPVYLSLTAEKLMEAHIAAWGARSRACNCCAAGWNDIPRSTCSTRCFVQSSTMPGLRRPTQLVREELRRNPTCSAWTSCWKRRSWSSRRAPPRPGTDQEPDSQPHPPCRALPLRRLRFQGPPVLLALPGLRWLGDLPAAAHRRIRHYALGNP